MHSLHYHRAGIEQPPVLPRPGDIDIEIAAQTGTTVTLNTHTEVFRASCGLWTVFNDVIWKYYNKEGIDVSPKHISPDFAEGIFRRLLQWADNLPLSVVRSSENGHAVMMMQYVILAILPRLLSHGSPLSFVLQHLLSRRDNKRVSTTGTIQGTKPSTCVILYTTSYSRGRIRRLNQPTQAIAHFVPGQV